MTVILRRHCCACPWWPCGHIHSADEARETQILTVLGTPREWQGWVALGGLAPLQLPLQLGFMLKGRLGSGKGLRGSCPASDSISILR